MKIFISVAVAAGLIAGPGAARALAGTNVSFAVTAAPVTPAGGPGIVITRTWKDGVLTISAD
jgi:hypothetical protein